MGNESGKQGEDKYLMLSDTETRKLAEWAKRSGEEEQKRAEGGKQGK